MNGIFALVVQASGFPILLMDGLKGAFNPKFRGTHAGSGGPPCADGPFLFSDEAAALVRVDVS